MNPRIQTLIDSLQLQPHPEGGYYREVFRSEGVISADGGRGQRKALTAIYFLLAAGQHSRWHRVLSDEVWSHLEGDPLELLCFDAESAQLTSIRLGPYAPETEAIHVVPAGIWQAAQPLGEYALVGCSVGPGFEFVDFSMAIDHPDLTNVIRACGDKAAKLIKLNSPYAVRRTLLNGKSQIERFCWFNETFSPVRCDALTQIS